MLSAHLPSATETHARTLARLLAASRLAIHHSLQSPSVWQNHSFTAMNCSLARRYQAEQAGDIVADEAQTEAEEAAALEKQRQRLLRGGRRTSVREFVRVRLCVCWACMRVGGGAIHSNGSPASCLGRSSCMRAVSVVAVAPARSAPLHCTLPLHDKQLHTHRAVSYTHLTLPTIYSV